MSCADPALEGRHPFFEGGGCRVADPRVDVPEGLEREQIGGVLGIIEDE